MEKRKFKPGDIVKDKQGGKFIVYGNYPNGKISLCLYGFDDVEQDYQRDEKDFELI